MNEKTIDLSTIDTDDLVAELEARDFIDVTKLTEGVHATIPAKGPARIVIIRDGE